MRSIEKKTFLKVAVFKMTKTFWPRFRRFIECVKPPKTIYMSPRAILTITVECIGAFSKEPKRLMKTQLFEKKATFRVK